MRKSMIVSIIIVSMLTLLALYGAIELGIDIMSDNVFVGLIVMITMVILLVATYYYSLINSLRKKQKRFLFFALVTSLVILNIVILRNQIEELWNELFRTISGPGSIPNQIELD